MNKYGEKMKHVYHVCCQFIKSEKSAYLDTVFTSEKRIDCNNYDSVKQQIWDKSPDNIHENFEKINMSIISLSYLHAEA